MTMPMKEVSLSEICRVIGGGTPSKSREDFYRGTIPWATVRDMNNDQLSQTEFRITLEAVANSSTNIIPAGNVIIATRVGLGKVCLLSQDTAINQDLKGILPKKQSEIDPKYLFWWFKAITKQIEDEGTGATVQGVKLPFIKGLQIPLPPLPEQKRIVAILDEAFAGIDAAIANTEKNIGSAENLKKRFIQTLLKPATADWVTEPISECFKVKSGEFLPKKKMKVSGSTTVYGGNGPTGTHNEHNLSGTNIIIGRVGAKCGNIRCVSGQIWLTDNAFYISDYHKPFDHDFLALLLEFVELGKYATQTAQPVISYRTIKPVDLSFPVKIEEQFSIVKRYKDFLVEQSKLIESYFIKAKALKELKQSLLQKAFSGKLTSKDVAA